MLRRFWEGAVRGGYVGHGETYGTARSTSGAIGIDALHAGVGDPRPGVIEVSLKVVDEKQVVVGVFRRDEFPDPAPSQVPSSAAGARSRYTLSPS
jgi:hypothetical protein